MATGQVPRYYKRVDRSGFVGNSQILAKPFIQYGLTHFYGLPHDNKLYMMTRLLKTWLLTGRGGLAYDNDPATANSLYRTGIEKLPKSKWKVDSLRR